MGYFYKAMLLTIIYKGMRSIARVPQKGFQLMGLLIILFTGT